MAYSEEADLLIGNLLLDPAIEPQKFIDLAAEEMDSKLGWVYALPLKPADNPAGTFADLPSHEVSLLKLINNKLASGRLILAMTAAAEESQLHAYGWHLVKEANRDLMYLANGEVLLSATRAIIAVEPDKTPGIYNHDEESLVDAFENNVMRATPWWTQPGAVT